MAAILNFGKTLKISHASTYRGECESKILIIYDSSFRVFATSKKLKLIHGGHFEFQQHLKKITCTSPYCGNVIVKFE